MIKAVIFDLDGVLVSTDELHYKAWKRLADELGIRGFSKEDNEKQRGVSRMASLEIVLQKGNRTYSKEEKVILAEKKNEYYKELLLSLDDSAVLPGVVDTLKKLKENNIRIGVGSASKNTHKILEKTNLISYIDEISCGLDTSRSKPEPDVFIIAAYKLGAENSKCLVVEDAKAGVEAASQAGMKTFGVGPYYQELGADYWAGGLNENIDWHEILGDLSSE